LWWKNCNKAGEQNSYSMYGFLIIMPISISWINCHFGPGQRHLNCYH
jgi:hypothetical protein